MNVLYLKYTIQLRQLKTFLIKNRNFLPSVFLKMVYSVRSDLWLMPKYRHYATQYTDTIVAGCLFIELAKFTVFKRYNYQLIFILRWNNISLNANPLKLLNLCQIVTSPDSHNIFGLKPSDTLTHLDTSPYFLDIVICYFRVKNYLTRVCKVN